MFFFFHLLPISLISEMGVGEGVSMWEGEDMYVFCIANGRSLAVALVTLYVMRFLFFRFCCVPLCMSFIRGILKFIQLCPKKRSQEG